MARSPPPSDENPWWRQVEAGVSSMDPPRWRMQVEVRLAALERQLAGLHGLQRSTDVSGGPRGAEDGKRLEAESDTELSEEGGLGSVASPLWGFCAPAADAEISRLGGPSGLKELVAEDVDDMHKYQLCESIWDSALLIGLDYVSVGSSCILVLTMLCNLYVQIWFCLFLRRNMVQDPFREEKLSSLLKFRTSTAHNIRHADLGGGRSLASQICGQDDTLPWAGSQFSLFSQVHSYLGEGGHAGGTLCLMSIFLWIVKMGAEMIEAWHYGIAVWELPRQRRTVIAHDRAGDAKLICVTPLRLLGTLVVLLFRLGIGVNLLWIGVGYLVFTTSLPDLILNSMALAFVIDIDEMLYFAFVPRQVKNLQASIAALPITTSWFSKRMPSVTSWMRGLLVYLLVWAIEVRLLWPFCERVVMASEILCSGNLDFVYAVNPASNIVSATPTFRDSSADQGLQERASVMKLAFPSLFYGPEPVFSWDFTSKRPSAGERRLFDWLPHKFSDAYPKYSWTHIAAVVEILDAMLTTDMTAKILANTGDIRELANGTEYLRPNPENMALVNQLSIGGVPGGGREEMCSDMLPAQLPAAFEAAIRGILPDAKGMAPNFTLMDDAHVCWQFTEMCQFRNMTSLRALCPVTCGCHMDDSAPAAFYGHQTWGCPHQCKFIQQAVLRWLEQHDKSVPCTDASPEDFASKETRHVPARSRVSENSLPLNNYLAAYIDGAFEHVSARLDFAASAKTVTRNPRVWGPMNLSVEERDHMAEFMTSWDFVRATQAMRWEFLPGRSHPRSLRGCDFWTSWEMIAIWGINFCELGHFRTFRFQCPEACRCSRHKAECPLTCG